MLADVLRTDRARLRPLIPDSPETVTLRQACRARKDLVRHRVAVGNQLRACLLSVFPGPAALFGRLDSAISLAFLARFGCQDRAGWLPGKRLAAWLKGAGYSGRTSPAVLYRRLRSAQAGDPARRPGCALTAEVLTGQIALCRPCARARSTLGKGTVPMPLPPGPAFDVLDWSPRPTPLSARPSATSPRPSPAPGKAAAPGPRSQAGSASPGRPPSSASEVILAERLTRGYSYMFVYLGASRAAARL